MYEPGIYVPREVLPFALIAPELMSPIAIIWGGVGPYVGEEMNALEFSELIDTTTWLALGIEVT